MRLGNWSRRWRPVIGVLAVGAGLWAPGKFSVAQTNYIHALVNDTVLSNPSEWNIALP